MKNDLGLIGVKSRLLPQPKGGRRWATFNYRADSQVDNAVLGLYYRLFRHANYREILQRCEGKNIGYFAQVSEGFLAEKGNLSERTIIKDIKKLLDIGWITVAIRGKKGRPTVYRIPHAK